MEHLTTQQKRTLAIAAFDWYHQLGYNTELSFFHGISEYCVTVYEQIEDTVPPRCFLLDHPGIKCEVHVSPNVTIHEWHIPVDYGSIMYKISEK